MSSREVMKFKAAIRAMATAEGVAAQVVLQHFMFERLFARIVRAPIKDNLIVKGGYLVSNILGLAKRTTMDLDATLTNTPNRMSPSVSGDTRLRPFLRRKSRPYSPEVSSIRVRAISMMLLFLQKRASPIRLFSPRPLKRRAITGRRQASWRSPTSFLIRSEATRGCKSNGINTDGNMPLQRLILLKMSAMSLQSFSLRLRSKMNRTIVKIPPLIIYHLYFILFILPPQPVINMIQY